MTTEQTKTGKGSPSDRILDVGLVILLFALALATRWLFAKAVVFPPLDDPAFYLKTAENLVDGRGLEVDALWSYQDPALAVTHPSHEHWMPLPTGLIAAAFAVQRFVFGVPEPTFPVGQIPGLILGALLVPLTYVVGRRILPGKGNRWLALAAALLVAINATLAYQSASADSGAPFAFLAAWALALAVRKPGDTGGYFGTGLLIGLAYLTRSDGLLLLPAIPLAWWLLPAAPSFRPKAAALLDSSRTEKSWELLHRQKEPDEDGWLGAGPSFWSALDLIVAFGLVVIAWLVRNYLAFGTPLPGSVLSQAWLSDYVDTFNYWSHPTWESLVAEGWPAIVAQRGQALLHNGQVLLLTTFPWGLLALPGLWLLRQRWAFYPLLFYGLLLFFVSAILFPVSSLSGTFYHSVGALVPFLALAAVYAVHCGAVRLTRRRQRSLPLFAIVSVGLLLLAGGQAGFAVPGVTERHQSEKEQFEAAATWLAGHAAAGDVIMTTQPYTLNYASGQPCIVLPGNEPPEAAWEAAQRYGARFLVITQAFGRYPQILHEQPDARFRLVEASDHLEIYEIGGEQP
jgi:hypothetical protein